MKANWSIFFFPDLAKDVLHILRMKEITISTVSTTTIQWTNVMLPSYSWVSRARHTHHGRCGKRNWAPARAVVVLPGVPARHHHRSAMTEVLRQIPRRYSADHVPHHFQRRTKELLWIIMKICQGNAGWVDNFQMCLKSEAKPRCICLCTKVKQQFIQATQRI